MNSSIIKKEPVCVKFEVFPFEDPLPLVPFVPPVEESEFAQIWNFLIMQTRDTNGNCLKHFLSPFAESLWKRYKTKTGSRTSVASLQNTFSKNLSDKIQTADLDGATRVKLHYSYDIPIEGNFLEKLKAHADVQVNANGCIEFYKEHEENGLRLSEDNVMNVHEWEKQMGERDLGDSDEEDRKVTASVTNCAQKIRNTFTDADEHSMWEFLLEKIKDPKTGKIERDVVKAKGNVVWAEYKNVHDPKRTENGLSTRFRKHMVHKLHLANLDVQSKVNLYYALSIPVEKKFLEELEKTACVHLDQGSCIVKYHKRGMSESNSPCEQNDLRGSVSRLDRKRCSTSDIDSTPKSSKRVLPVRHCTTENYKVIEDYEPLLRDYTNSTETPDPLKRVHIEKNNVVTKTVKTLIAPQNEAETEQNVDRKGRESSVPISLPDETSQDVSDPLTPTTPRFSSGVTVNQLIASLGEPIKKVNLALINAVKAITPNEASLTIHPTPPLEDSKSTKDFLKVIERMIVSLHSPSLDDCLQTVRSLSNETGDEKSIPMERIKLILNATLAMIPR